MSDDNIVNFDEAKEAVTEKKKREPRAPKEVNWGGLNTLKKHFALIYGQEEVWDGMNRMMMSLGALRAAYTPDVVKMWLSSADCKQVPLRDVLFAPGQEVKPNQINLFNGLELKPMPGDCQPILDLLNYLCANVASPDGEVTVENMVHWITCWLALPLQKMGTKMRSALIFHGDQGAGKNLFFEAVRDIYGEYGIIVGQDQLDDKFNDWASRKLFVGGDEVLTRSELAHAKNKLKAMVTGKEIQINPKNRSMRTEANHMNIVFLSNELQPLQLEDGDRRHCVVFTPPALGKDFYDEIGRWLKHDNGHAKFLNYLLNYKITNFDEHSKPPMSQAKLDLIELSSRHSERFVLEWKQGLTPLPFVSCTTDQIFQAYKRWCAIEGERFPRSKLVFVREAIRKLGEVAAQSTTNVMVGYKRTTVKFWRIDSPDNPAPLEGETAAAFNKRCFDLFQTDLDGYLKERVSNDG